MRGPERTGEAALAGQAEDVEQVIAARRAGALEQLAHEARVLALGQQRVAERGLLAAEEAQPPDPEPGDHHERQHRDQPAARSATWTASRAPAP